MQRPEIWCLSVFGGGATHLLRLGRQLSDIHQLRDPYCRLCSPVAVAVPRRAGPSDLDREWNVIVVSENAKHHDIRRRGRLAGYRTTPCFASTANVVKLLFQIRMKTPLQTSWTSQRTSDGARPQRRRTQ